MLIEGIHFDLTYHPIKHLGYKSVSTNLSDIYSMNGIADQITINLGLSNRFSLNAIQEFYKGVKIACKEYNVDLSNQSKGIYFVSIITKDKQRIVRKLLRY